MGAGSFPLSAQCTIRFESRLAGAKPTAEYLAAMLRSGLGFPFQVRQGDNAKGGAILLTSVGANESLGRDGYRLEVTPRGVVIRARTAAGLFYGAQTLRQLLPAGTFSPRKNTGRDAITIPCVRIEDYPRFQWRGMHLDVSRHFFDVEFVKRYLDQLAMHKFNVFHWHLTDDDGWRVEIKQYPRLTQVGAWRGPDEALPPSYESGYQRYGGFYTQRQIREIARATAHRRGRPVVVTLAHRGILGALPSGEVYHLPALPVRGPLDIVGAGDAVTANVTTALASGATLPEALEMGDLAASIVIHQLGDTGTASVAQLRKLLR